MDALVFETFKQATHHVKLAINEATATLVHRRLVRAAPLVEILVILKVADVAKMIQPVAALLSATALITLKAAREKILQVAQQKAPQRLV